MEKDEMKSETHSFQVGDFECFAVNDGILVYKDPGPTFFTNAPTDQLAHSLHLHGIELGEWKEYLSPFICLVIKTTETCLLVDTGLGSSFLGVDPEFTDGKGRLLHHLKEIGISPEQVDLVLLTHGHPDHIGGITDSDGSISFPKARFVMFKSEWDFWASRLTQNKDDLSDKFARKNLVPLSGHIELIDQDTEVLPGITAISVPGHLPGHMIVSIRSRAYQLLYTSDTFIHALHVEHPEWYTVFENKSEQAVSSRMKVLERAADENALVLSFHFPFPGLGHIFRENGTYRWQPLETAT